jgi:hypothetical protein
MASPDPVDLIELARSSPAYVLTLVRVRRDLGVHDVGYLSEQLLEHERPPLAERRRVSGLCSVGKVTVGDAAAACARNI